MSSSTLLYSVIFWCLAAATANNTSGKLNDVGAFQNPSAKVRPRFRYWLPDPTVDKAVVAKNIKDAGDLGAGGVEFIPFYGYGGSIDTYIPESDWSRNGFGTPAFLDMFQAALEAHKENGLVMGFALGPNQGQGVPADSNDEGLQWDLVSHSSPVSTNGSFTDVVPGWGSGDFVALVSAQALSEANVSMSDSTSYTRLMLSHGSLRDFTSEVSRSGHFSSHFGHHQNGTTWLFAFYEKRTLAQNLGFPSNATSTIWDNGSYTVDHFSAAGARVTEKFWKEHVLNDEIKELVKEVGNYAWEDSLEIRSTISWTPAIPTKFEQKFGYSIRPFLPLIMWGNNNLEMQGSEPGQVQCLLDTDDAGQGYVNDYRALLQECYREYLQELQRWVHEDLGLQTSSQVSYNLPMDAAANVLFSDAPECESLQWHSNVDGYRQFTGAAHLAGKRVVSNELGAIKNKAFQLTIPDLLWIVNRAVAGGVNQVVIHGQTYSGNYYNTTWPGYTPFSYIFSEVFSEKQPSWEHGLAEAMEYIARVQFVQQQGIPRADVAIYNKVSASNPEFPTVYRFDNLVKEGWTYEYLTAENFRLPQARVEDKVLAPDGPRYKAMVLPNSSNLTLEAIHDLKGFAEAGLPIVFSGNAHDYYHSGNNSEETAAQSGIADLLKSENVYSCQNDDLPQLLSFLSLKPQIRTETNGTLHTTWREDPLTDLDYAFLFCDGPSCRANLHVSSTKTPYLLNPWTGATTPVLTYTLQNTTTILPLHLHTNQTLLLAFATTPLDNKTTTPPFHATSAPPNLLGYTYTNPHTLTLRLSHPPSSHPHSTLTLSTGQSLNLTSTTLPSFPLTNWTLTAEHWEAPTSMSDASIIAAKRNTTHTLPSLVSWATIPGLHNTSGIGYYSTSFPWPPSAGNAADGAYIRFSHILHAATVCINGHRLPPLDCNAAEADMGPYLVQGGNRVDVVVPTTMWNYLRSILSDIVHVGAEPLLVTLAGMGLQGVEVSPEMEVGLVGSVEVVPYREVEVEG